MSLSLSKYFIKGYALIPEKLWLVQWHLHTILCETTSVLLHLCFHGFHGFFGFSQVFSVSRNQKPRNPETQINDIILIKTESKSKSIYMTCTPRATHPHPHHSCMPFCSPSPSPPQLHAIPLTFALCHQGPHYFPTHCSHIMTR